MSIIDQTRVSNRILAALPANEFAALAKHLTHVEMTLGETLSRAGDPITSVHFVESGFISVLAVLSDGQPLEIGLIGAEGVAGVAPTSPIPTLPSNPKPRGGSITPASRPNPAPIANQVTKGSGNWTAPPLRR